MGFISVILTIIFVFWILSILSRLFLRAWILKQQKRFTQQMGGGFAGANAYQKQQQQQQNKRPEGDVQVQQTAQTTATHKPVDKNIGDYVDFEEEK